MPTALITGATAGIGAPFPRRAAKDGLDLVLVARNTEKLNETAEALRGSYGVAVEVLPADLSEDADIARVEERLRQGVDLLVNNAGFGHQGTFLDVPVEEELRMLKVHCEAVLRLTYAALPGMRNRRKGGIINVASVAAFLTRGTYGASKAWVVSFSQAVAQDVKDPNVKVMALCPGFVRTEFHERAKMDVSRIPEALWLDADDVADAAMKDLRKGVQISVPGPQYKAVVGFSRLVPRNLVGRISSRTGRRYD